MVSRKQNIQPKREKVTVSVLLRLFIDSNGKCNNINAPLAPSKQISVSIMMKIMSKSVEIVTNVTNLNAYRHVKNEKYHTLK
jgi:hypothetical protein